MIQYRIHDETRQDKGTKLTNNRATHVSTASQLSGNIEKMDGMAAVCQSGCGPSFWGNEQRAARGVSLMIRDVQCSASLLQR